MNPKNLKSQIIYSAVCGLIYALFIATVDFFKDKEFSLKKAVLGCAFFAIGMFVLTQIRNKKKNKC